MVIFRNTLGYSLKQASKDGTAGHRSTIPFSISQAGKKIFCISTLCAVLALWLMSFSVAYAGTHASGTPSTRSTYWATNCSGCHGVTPANFTTNSLAYYATNPANITTATIGAGPGTVMTATNTTNAQTNQNDISAYFASLFTPNLTNPGTTTQASGSAYSYQIVSAATSDYLVSTTTYGATGLPAGITINTATGAISGTLPAVTTPTNYTVTLSATNTDATLSTGGTTPPTFTLTVIPPTVTGVSKLLGIQVDAGYMFDDNVTRAKESADKLADRSYSANLSKVIIFPVTEYARAILTGSLSGEKFDHYDGLSRVIGGVQGEYQYRSSAEFGTPTFAIFAKTFAEQYESVLRDGYHYSTGVSVREPVTDRIRLFGAMAHNVRKGKSAVFDTRDNSARLNLDYAATPAGTMYLGGEFRRGDVVSTGSISLENIDTAKVFAQDDAFPGGQLFSYRFDAKTVLTTLGYNIGFGPRGSLDFSWRRVKSTPVWRPTYATSASSYVANQFSIVYLVTF